MGSYRPACVVHLRLRLDEAFHVIDIPLVTSTEELVQRLREAPVQTPALRPLFLSGQSPDGLSRVNNIIPAKASVELAGYRQGGKFSIKLPYRKLPIDPRLYRSCGVEIHFGCISASDFATGMQRIEPNGRRLSMLQTTRDTLALVGTVDKPSLDVDEDGAVLSFEGRDNVGILADSPIDPKLVSSLALSEPIDSVVAQILATHPFGDQFMVSVNPDEWPNGLPSPGTKDGLTRVRQKADGKGARAHPGADTSTSVSFWDLITQYCFLVGAVPYFDAGGFLRIRPAVSLYDYLKAEGGDFDPRIRSPFAGGAPRVVELGDRHKSMLYRRMIFGRNISELHFERKLQGTKARVVEIIAIDDDATTRGAGKLLTVQWPKNKSDDATRAARRTSITPSGSAASTEKMRIPVYGIRDPAQLKQIAQAVFEEVMRQEISGHVQTQDLSSFGGDDADPDLLKLRPGDPVEILIDAAAFSRNAPHVAELLKHKRRGFEEEVDAVFADIGDRNLARAIVATSRNAIPELQNTFRTNTARFDWEGDSETPAISIAFDFQNYVEARLGVTPSTGANRSAPKTTAVAVPR